MPDKPKDEELGEAEFFEVLSHEVRRSIIRLLYEKVEMSYTELLETLKIGDGTLNFHLRKLKKLIHHTEKGTYILSEYGRFAYNIMHSVSSTVKGEASHLMHFKPTLSADIVMRRVAAMLIDALIFFVFTGMVFDPTFWGLLQESIFHLTKTIEPHPWLFHSEHLPLIGEVFYRTAAIYAHVFFAIFVIITLLEAFKGQTLGKYLLGIRVVKVGGGKEGLLESGIRNAGKVFLLPLDLLIGILFYRKKGYLRFFDYYTETTVERVTLIKS
jgi:uncharacterized RDD family membrane protein YckC